MVIREKLGTLAASDDVDTNVGVKPKRKVRSLIEKIVPVLMIASIALAFAVGVLWQKVQNLEGGGIRVAGNTTVGAANPSGAAAQPAAAGSADQVKKLQKDDHVRGDRNSRVLLIEYSDYECPFCKRFHPTTQQILDTYKGKVALVYRHYPLPFHANAQKEAEASECINELGGNDAFWKYTDAIYERTTSNGTGFALDKLGPLAKEVGVDQTKFQNCLDSGKYADHIKKDFDEGAKAGVSGTPGNILLDTKTGKTKLIPGAVPFDNFKTEIDSMLSAT